MPAEANIQVKENFLKAQDINFTYKFEEKITGLQKLLSAMRLTPMPAGATIKTKKSTNVTLAGGAVPEGEVIPLSKVQFVDGDSYELAWDKRRKPVPGEVIQRYGLATAVTMTDEALFNELIKNLRNTLYTNLKSGTGTATGVGFQGALAKIWGLPYGMEIVGTITAVDLFLGTLLGISTAEYNKNNL